MSLESAIALCRALDVSLDWFLVGYGSMDQHTAKRDTTGVDDRLWSSFSKLGSTMSTQSKSLLIAFMDSLLPR
jgi:hypothetical protein